MLSNLSGNVDHVSFPNTTDLNASPSPQVMQGKNALDFTVQLSRSASETLGQALQSAETALSQFSTDPNFASKMKVAFGDRWNPQIAKQLFQVWAAHDFRNLPKLEIHLGAEINNANGAFASATNTIYISSDFLAQSASNPNAVASVLLEEIGHAIDFRINKFDAAGDEGDIFSRLVRGEEISASDLLQLKAEDDHAVVKINGRETAIEMSQIAMVSLNGRIYQSTQGTDNTIYTRISTDGVNWTSWNNNGGGTTPSAPTLTVLNGRLYQAVRGTDNQIYTRSGTDGVNWTGWNNNGGGTTPSAPTLTVLNGRLYQAVRGTDNQIYTRSGTDGVNWTGWNNNGGGTTPDAPSLEVFNGRLYQSCQGTNNLIYTRSSTDGINWTTWIEKGGTTPTETSNTGVWRASYYNNANLSGNLVFERPESTINYDWGTGSPDARINQDNFSVRWEGQFQFDGGSYTFKPNTDDGVRIWIDGQLVRDSWNSPTTDSFGRDMSVGLHLLKVEYRELGGFARAKFSWDRVTSPSGLMATSVYLTQLQNGQLNGQYKDVDGYYGAQCWDLVAYAAGINSSSTFWSTNNWKPGVNVIANKAVAVGTAIATFLGPNATYNSSSGQHTAIFAGYGAENGVSGFYVWDQNFDAYLNGDLSIKKHFIRTDRSGTSDADNFYVVTV